MLKHLSIKNYALIESIEVEFERGLNIITGETGAGKSIIIDALSLVLGERASMDEVRKGADKAVVEGIFGVANNRRVQSFLAANDVECPGDLILRREVSAKGQSRCFVNDSPAPLNILKSIGDLLVDMHGQHEHQSLLRVETHIDLLDDFGGLDGLGQEFRRSYDNLSALFFQVDELTKMELQLREKKDLYEFQIKEIDAVNPQPDEEQQLESELTILNSAERLHATTAELYRVLYEGDNTVYDALVKARNQLEDLAEIDPSLADSKRECESAVAIIGELTKFIQGYNSKIEFNPERLEHIRERLGQISLLKKKYGGSLQSTLDHRTKIGREFTIAENFDSEIGKLVQRIDEERAVCSSAAQRLSAKRRELTAKINKSVTAELARLGIDNSRFDVVIESRAIGDTTGASDHVYVKLGRDSYDATPRGIDKVEFFLSTNVGEDLKPLVKVASGGEVSRVMLALKTILAKSERLPLLIFDEIDSGISGRIAQGVGRSLKNLSQFHQIIAITHLPQIAGQADMHYVVEKVEKKDRTMTNLRVLELEERVEQVAKLMSGAEVTEAGLEGARELMGLK